MKLANANAIRQGIVENLLAHMSDNCGEECGMIASNSFNFPVVSADGEEGWVEIVVKVTKEAGDDGYMKREQYGDKLKAAEAREKAKAEKLAKAQAKAKAKAEKENQE